jgi:hypothetical protein
MESARPVTSATKEALILFMEMQDAVTLSLSRKRQPRLPIAPNKY